MIVPHSTRLTSSRLQRPAPPAGAVRRPRLSDASLLTAMGCWLLSSASYRARLSLACEPDAWEWLGSARAWDSVAAGIVLAHALERQPEDLDRLIRSKHFLHGGGPLLSAAWGRADAPAPVAGAEPDILAPAWAFFRRSWWWLVPCCLLGVRLLGCLMAIGGAR